MIRPVSTKKTVIYNLHQVYRKYSNKVPPICAFLLQTVKCDEMLLFYMRRALFYSSVELLFKMNNWLFVVKSPWKAILIFYHFDKSVYDFLTRSRVNPLLD